jgi:hypothetical protein
VTARCLLVCSALLLLFANGAYGTGRYQRTKDGKALIWNDNPGRSEEAIWSGGRDPNGYAIGPGTLTWYRAKRNFLTGATIPSPKAGAVVNTYSGNMVRGKLNGPVVKVDAKGKTFYANFANGNKIGYWSAGPAPAPTPDQRRNERGPGSAVVEAPAKEPAPSPDQRRNESVRTGPVVEASPQGPALVPNQRRNERVHTDAVAEAPAEGPAAVPDERRNKRVKTEAPAEGPEPDLDQGRNESVHEGAVVEAPTQRGASLELGTPASALQRSLVAAASLRASVPPTPPAPSSSPAGIDPIVTNRIIADFKEETQSVLSRVGDATANFHEIDRLESVQKLPAPVSESVGSLVERARDFRAKVGYETALHEYRAETETVDALSVVDQITRNIAANDASEANARVADFLKSNPEPTADSQKGLWRYLTSVRLLCSRSERDADIHLQRAKSLASAGKTSEAIREYQEAYRIFPNPVTAEKIRQLQDNSLGL